MPTTSEIIETQLRIAGASAYSGALRMVTSATSMASSALSSLTSGLNPLSMALGAIGAGITLHGIAAVNAEFEESQRLIAGIFTTMGMAGNFNAGLTMAAQTMDQITVAAARLPGEAEDYINVFQTGLTVVRQTFAGSTQDMTAFTNQYTAIMSTLGVSSMEAGMSLTRALAGGRGQVDQQSAAFMRLLPFIQQATRGTQHQVDSITQFNALTQQQRGDVLQLTLAQEGLVQMLNNAGSSWGAQTGALASMVRMMGRMASSPLFEAMKTWLGQFNALFMDTSGNLTTLGMALTSIGEFLSGTIVQGINELMAFLAPGANALYEIGKSIADWLSPIIMGLGNSAGRFRLLIDNFWPFVSTIVEGFQSMISIFEPFTPILLDYIDFMLRIVTVIGHLLPLWGAMVRISNSMFNALGAIVSALIGVSFGAQRTDSAFDMLIQAIDLAAVGMEMLADRVARGVQVFQGMITQFMPQTGSGSSQPSLLGSLSAAIADARAKAESRRHEAAAGGAGAAPPTPAHRPGTSVHQDFRYSRFDITQRFAEGFDPDRIAVAFADDVGRLGEQRLQSGLEPLFGPR